MTLSQKQHMSTAIICLYEESLTTFNQTSLDRKYHKHAYIAWDRLAQLLRH